MTLSIKERQEKAYKLDNYKVIDLDNKKSNICYVFCSSNGLYTSLDSNKIFDKNKYEWENICQNKKIRKNAIRIIFLRDIYCHSYVDGINERVNSIFKIVELIKDLTKGYDVYTVGYSGGGYLSMILGCYLDNCTRVYSFGGLFNLRLWHGDHSNYCFEQCGFYTKYLNTPREKFYEIKNLIINTKSKDKILHFYGSLHKEDVLQIDYIGTRVDSIPINSDKHSDGLFSFDLVKLITINDKRFNKISKIKIKRKLTPTTFSIKYFGLCHYLWGQINRSFKRLKRMWKK